MTTALPLADLFTAQDWFTLLDASLAGIHLARPLYALDGTELVDFVIEYVNPAGQRMTGLPEQPGDTLLNRFPHAVAAGIFHYYRRVFETGESSTYKTNYQADGLDNYFCIVARRSGERLLVSFTDTSDQDRSTVEVALRESQAAERAARQQGEQLNQELAVINEELRATNDGYLLSTTALSKTQQQLRQLNAELEARVAERTRQLVDQQAMLLQIQSKLPAYLVTFSGPNHVYTYFNEAYGHDLAQGRAELGRTLVDCFPELVEQGFIAALDSVYASGQPITFLETPVVLYDPLTQQARTCYVNMSYHRLHTEAGDPQGMLGFATDVTEQVLARLEREGERRRIERLFREAPAAICILNGPDLVYELVNVNYQQLFPARPLLGKPLLEALPELRASSTWDTLQQVYRTGQTHVDRSVRIPLGRLQDGVLEDVYFDYVFQARTDIQGQSDGVVVFAFDITEQVRVRQQVQDLNQELAAINEELTATNEELYDTNAQLTRTNVDLDTFVYTASHDLKAPITNIEGIVLALRETLPPTVQQDEVVAHLLELLNQTVTRFQLTIGQLTDISRLQLAHVGPAEPVVLATVVEAVRLDLLPAIEAANTQLTVEVAPELLLSFSPANLRSIVYNLLSNAIKYRALDRPSHVWVRAEQTSQAVVLTVRDNGLGMSEPQQRQLFGLFQRLHTHVEGTGVGLYITKRLIENAGSTITVQSEPDTGTTFTVSFPA